MANVQKIILIIFVILFCASVLTNVYLVFHAFKITEALNKQKINEKVLIFRNMFSENVLLGEKEVDFDTRLTLETAVRNLNDPEIFNQWQAFTKAQTKEDTTRQAKKLLNLLIQKTSL